MSLGRLTLAGLVLVSWLAVGGAVAAPEQPPAWSTLSAAQKDALAPLQRDWPGLDSTRKQKWLEVAARFPRLSVDERKRLQARMRSWAAMSPAERALAREQFQQSRQLPADERQARWQAYQALPESERSKLGRKEVPPASVKPPLAGDATARRADAAASGTVPAAGKRTATAAANDPGRGAHTPPPQARPGATTTTLTTRATPPLHHQAGLPKIAATPTFVDPATLLPRRGPQGAAVRPAPASSVAPAASPASAATPL